MITKRVGRLTLKLYNGIDELPAERYHKFNLYSLMDSGIGSDVEAIKNHISQIYMALSKKDFERLTIMFQNYYHSLYLITEGMDTKSMAFGCLVHSMNGNEVTDISEDGLKRIGKRITKAEKRQAIVSLLDEIKKKLKRKSKPISPVEVAEQKQRLIIASLKGVQI